MNRDNMTEEMYDYDNTTVSYLSHLKEIFPKVSSGGPHHHATIILGVFTALVLIVSLLVACVRNCWYQIQTERRVRSLEWDLSVSNRPDSGLIQELEEEMLHYFHQDVLMSLQPLAHGHESTISVKGFNGVCLESTYSEEETAHFLGKIIQDSLQRENYLRFLENRNILVDLPRLPSTMRVRSRSIRRSKILADQTLRVMGVDDLERSEEETAQNNNDLIIEDDINPC